MLQSRFVGSAPSLLVCVLALQAAAQENSPRQFPNLASQSATANSQTQAPTSGGTFGGAVEAENGIGTQGAEIGVAKSGAQTAKQKREFASGPLPVLNPSLGNGMGGVVLYLVPLDSNPKTPASVFAVAGFGTGNGSWLVGLGTRMYLKNDRYRIK